MKCKDIFSNLIEENLKSNNPNPALVKYGDIFLEKLNIIGEQFERCLLSMDVDDNSIITIYDKNILDKINIGINIFDSVNKYVDKHNKTEITNNKNIDLEKQFVNEIKQYNDFIQAYIIKDYEIWIVIDKAMFEYNKKYLQHIRKFNKENNCNIDIMIFDKTEIEELNENVDGFGEYKLVKKE